jgi:hypothetical protein
VLFADRDKSLVARESSDQVLARTNCICVRRNGARGHDDLFECAVLVEERASFEAALDRASNDQVGIADAGELGFQLAVGKI